MVHQNSVITIWTGRYHVNGYTCDVLNALQIQASIDGQFVELRHTHSAVCPAFDGFINRRATRNIVCTHWQNIDHFAVKFITRAKFQLFQAVEHI